MKYRANLNRGGDNQTKTAMLWQNIIYAVLKETLRLLSKRMNKQVKKTTQFYPILQVPSVSC